MQKYNLICVLLLVGVTMISCEKQTKKRKEIPGSDRVYISGEIENGAAETDSIRFFFGGDIPLSRIGRYRKVVPVDDQGKFEVSFPATGKPERMSMYMLDKDEGQPYVEELINYFMEPGDSVHMGIKRKNGKISFTFSGRGARKLECRRMLDQLGAEENREYIHKETRKYSDITDVYERRVAIADSLVDIQIAKLDKYEKEISPEAYQVIRADIIGGANLWLKVLWNPRESSETQLLLSRRMVEEYGKMNLQSDVMAMSPSCIRYLSNIVMAQLIVENPGQEEYEILNVRSKKFGDMCSKLRTDYSGILREKLLLYNLQSLQVQDTYGIDECLKESYDLIQTPFLKKIMDSWYGKKVRGADAFNFVLPDTTGHMIRLKDFRGKVVYLDIWFTGCGGCANLAAEVDKKVYPEFRDNPDVVFVSVSFDKDREQWLKSVREEKYGLKEYVNLYTEGIGLDHPFMKYYNVSGGPTTMLIDKYGKVYSAAPPKHGHSKELIALIKKALEH